MIVTNNEIRRIRTRRRRKKLRRLVFSSEKYLRDEEKIRNMKEKSALYGGRESERENENEFPAFKVYVISPVFNVFRQK